MLVSRQAVNAYLDRELDSYLWMKGLTRRQLTSELSRFRVPPKFKTEPWTHQLVCQFIGMCVPNFLFVLDMGLGKTKILSDLITQVQREKRLRKALITVPRTLNMSSWSDDLLQHSDLEPWPCSASVIEEKWELLADPKGDVTVIDYQGLCLAVTEKKKGKGKGKKLVPDMKKIAHLQRLYNFIGMDESHYVKNSANTWFNVLDLVTMKADYVYATTGTLFGKEPIDAWAQFYLVDGGETLGDNPSLFRSAFYTPESNGFGNVWTFNKRTTADMHRLMQHRSLRYERDEVPEIDLPRRVLNKVEMDFGSEQRDHYLKALEGLINAQGGADEELKAPWIRMRQIIAGYLAWNDAAGAHTVRFKYNPKLDALERLLGDLDDSKMVICHEYTESGKLITEKLKELGIGFEWLYGGSKNKDQQRRRFMTDPECRVFVMNSAAGGTGNDGLQKVARYMVFYESPSSPTVREQTISRLHRPGQRERVFVYDLVIKRSLDRGILDDLEAGRDLYESIVNGRRLRREILRG